MIGGVAVTSLVLVASKGPRFHLGWLGLILALAIGVVGWVGMTGAVSSRLSTMADLGQTLAPRLNHWRDGVKAAGSFWMTGSGLGTYRFVYPPFQQRPDRLWYFHAENQYLEAWAEAGVGGVAILLLLIVLVSWACWRVLRRAEDGRAVAFAVTTLFALVSQAIHAFFDFGLYMPANLLLLALFCGAISATAGDVRRRGTAPAKRSLVGPRLLSAGLALGLLGLMAWGGRELGSLARAESAAQAAQVSCRRRRPTPKPWRPMSNRSAAQSLIWNKPSRRGPTTPNGTFAWLACTWTCTGCSSGTRCGRPRCR